jgi:hypothetical protein
MRAVSTPMEHGAEVSSADCPVTDEDKRAVDGKKYMELVGSLQYIAQGTRPDIAHATSRLATVLNNPGQVQYNMGLRVVRYLKSTRDYGLMLGGLGGNVTLSGMTDSGYATCPTTRRSVSGYAFSLGHGAVSWSSRKQDIVATSTCEAEYVAMSNAAKEALWLRQVLSEIGYQQNDASLILADNQGAIVLSEDQSNHQRSKHIDVRYHFIRERTANGEVAFKYVRSCNNVADIFTKALPYVTYARLRRRLGVRPFQADA